MILALILLLTALGAFFLGFYLRIVLHTLIDILNALSKLKMTQEQIQQQEQAAKEASAPTFVEPMSNAEWQALQEEERIKALNS